MTPHEIASLNNVMPLFLCAVMNKRENVQKNDHNGVISLTVISNSLEES
jgi:hypothetical protein